MSIPLGWVPPRLSISRLGTDRCYERCPGHGRGLVTEGLWLWDPPNEGSRSRRGWCSRNRRSAAVILRDVSSCGMAICDQANGREPRTARSSSTSFETGWRGRGARVPTPMASSHPRVDRRRPCARVLAHHQIEGVGEAAIGAVPVPLRREQVPRSHIGRVHRLPIEIPGRSCRCDRQSPCSSVVGPGDHAIPDHGGVATSGEANRH